MRRRTKARECALKILYAIDITKDDTEECMKNFWDNHESENEEIREFADYLVRGAKKNKVAIDDLLAKYATNWQIDRMAAIDRNVIRMATFELLFAEDIPPRVSINEAIELAKKYGDKDSSKFVNGVLDKINKQETKDKDGR